MSQENAELVRRLYEAFSNGDVEAALSYLHPEVEWSEPPQGPLTGPYLGPDGVRDSLNAWVRAWDAYELYLDHLVDAGDCVVASCRQRVRGKRSGIELEQQLFATWTLRDGKVTRMRMYHDEAEALRAAGLAE